MRRDDGRGPRELTAFSFAASVLRYWRPIAVLVGAAVVSVALWTLARPATYTASAQFIVRGTEVESRGGLSAMAGQFGIPLGVRPASASPEFYAHAVTSRSVLRRVADGLSEEALEPGSSDGEGARPGPLWARIGVSERESEAARRQAELEWLQRVVRVGVARATGVVSVEVTAPSPELSTGIASALLAALSEFDQDRRMGQAAEERRFFGDRLSQIEDGLAQSETALQDFLLANRQFERDPELRLEYDRLRRRVDFHQQLFLTVARMLEEARIAEVRDIPGIAVLTPPEEPFRPDGKGWALRLFLAAATALVAGCVGAVGWDTFRFLVREDPSGWDELVRALRGGAPSAARTQPEGVERRLP